MPFPVPEALLEAAEAQLGRRLPPELRARLLRNNGGEILAYHAGEEPDEEEDVWYLHPIRDPTDRRRMSRTMNHIVNETGRAREWRGFPEGAIALAQNGTGDFLLLRGDSDGVEFWDHETGETNPVRVDWDFDLESRR